jgi:hypothetical protein
MSKKSIMSVVFRQALLLISVIGLYDLSFADQWSNTYGGANPDSGYSVQQTSDGGFIIAGETESFGNGSYDVYLIKADAAGTELWRKTFGGDDWDWVYSVQQTSDGGFIIAGGTYSAGAGDSDVYLIKTDDAGNEEWSSTFGEADYDSGYSVQETVDGGFIIAGETYSSGAGEADVYLIKTDDAGNEAWSNTFGGADYDWGYSVQQTDDGGFIIAGETYSSGAGEADVYLIKADAAGNEAWSNTFGGSEWDSGNSVQQSIDGGFIIAGETESFGSGAVDVYLIKADAEGNELWSKTFGGAEPDSGYSVQQTGDGGFIIAGETQSFGSGGADVYLIKADAEGMEAWSKTFGGVEPDSGNSVQQTSDGGYIISGATESSGAGEVDVYLVYFDGATCEGDIEPAEGDGDVDGKDLATYIGGGTGTSLADFAAGFGRTDC